VSNGRTLTIALLTTIACARTSASRTPAVVVQLQTDTVVATVATTGGGSTLNFSVPFTAKNTGGVAVEYYAFSVEQEHGGVWTEVWAPITIGERTQLRPHSSLELRGSVFGVLEGPGDPVWASDTVEGMYRLVVAFVTPTSRSLLPVRSPVFSLIRR
jgi:hypothetical protein